MSDAQWRDRDGDVWEEQTPGRLTLGDHTMTRGWVEHTFGPLQPVAPPPPPADLLAGILLALRPMESPLDGKHDPEPTP